MSYQSYGQPAQQNVSQQMNQMSMGPRGGNYTGPPRPQSQPPTAYGNQPRGAAPYGAPANTMPGTQPPRQPGVMNQPPRQPGAPQPQSRPGSAGPGMPQPRGPGAQQPSYQPQMQQPHQNNQPMAGSQPPRPGMNASPPRQPAGFQQPMRQPSPQPQQPATHSMTSRTSSGGPSMAAGPPRPGMSPQPGIPGGPPRPGMSPQPLQPGMNTPPRQPPAMNQPPQQPGMGQQPPRQPGMAQQPPRQPGMAQQPPRQPGMVQQPPRQPAMGQPPRQPGMTAQPPRQPVMPPQQPMMNQPPRQPMMNQPPPMGGNPMMGGPPGPPVGGNPMMSGPPGPPMGQQMPPSQYSQGPQYGAGPQYNQPGASYGQNTMNSSASNKRAIDKSLVCDPAWMQTSFDVFPNSTTIATQSAIPLAVVVQPLAEHPEGKEPPVVNFGNVGVVRCDKCRAYINPFVQWLENGRRWRCNLCGRDNNTNPQYYNHLDGNGDRVDKMEKPELHEGCIEIVAPHEYMLRPPQAPVYMFVIDVSFEAVSSGMVATAVKAIHDCLDSVPGSPRTHVGIVTFDYAVHFYSLNSKLSQPKMFVVSDLDDCFVPQPEDLLVNLQDSRETFEMLLESLPRLHAKNSSHEVAAGSAVKAAFKMMSHIGGRMLVFQSKMPTLGLGKLDHREVVRTLGTEKEAALLKPSNEAAAKFYKTDTIEMAKFQVCVDLFIFSSGYCDVSTLSDQCKYSGGQCHYYPRFNSSVHGIGLTSDIQRSITRETSWEGVFRLRASNGIKVSPFYGNFFFRGADLMQVPNCDADSTFGLGLTHVDQVLSGDTLTIQGALLYTNSNGQRRIRVLTSCFNIATQVSEIIRSANQDVICNYLAKQATRVVVEKGFEEARSLFMKTCVDIMRATKLSGSTRGYGMPGQQQSQPQLLPDNLSLLPLYAMALQKNPAFRGGNEVGIDERAYLHQTISRMSMGISKRFVYPRMYEIDTMTPDCGRPVSIVSNQGHMEENLINFDAGQKIRLPRSVNLSISNLRSDGMFLIDNGVSLLLWVGRAVDKRLLQSVFGIPVLDGIDAGVLTVEPQPGDNDFKQRLCNILKGLRSQELGSVYQLLQIIKEGDPIEARFRWFFVEDRANYPGGAMSYPEFLNQCQRMSG